MEKCSKTNREWDKFWKKTSVNRSPVHGTISLARHYFDKAYAAYAFSMIGHVRGKSVLDAGCGTGMASLYLARKGASVTGIDLSKNSVQLAREGYVKQGLRKGHRFLTGNVMHMPFEDNVFDVVWNQGVIEHFRRPELAVGEMLRVVRKDGLVMVLVPHTYSFYQILHKVSELLGVWPFGHERSFSGSELKRLMERCSLVDVKARVLWSTLGIFVAVSGKKA